VTTAGVAVIDPRHIPKNLVAPTVEIQGVQADGATLAPESPLRLPSKTRILKLSFVALSLTEPQRIQFRYKLDGFDGEWHNPTGERQATYTNLPPREYKFRVMASNNDGVWNETGTVLDFSIAPAYYQTTWFRLSCFACFALLLWALHQLRLRQQAREFNMRLEERIGERTRIARDLHDTLLQGFHGLLLRFQTVYALLPGRPEEAKQSLASAIDQAAETITEGRDAVQDLRSSTVETNDLAVAIRALAEELSAGGTNPNATVFQIEVEGRPRNLHPLLRDEVYRIAAEALRNAFRHAQAGQIEVELQYDEMQLRLRIRDNGKGIEPKVLSEEGRAGHFGLHGMRERAKLAGGKLTVWSEHDSGTEVELVIPAATAYVTSPTGLHFWLSEKLAKRLSGKGSDWQERDSKETEERETKARS
jgi:signal transduction histidine kinase